MSNYRAPAFNPETGKIEEANWIDNHFGHHIYGVSFGGKVYREHEVGWDAVGAEIERLRVELATEEETVFSCMKALKEMSAAMRQIECLDNQQVPAVTRLAIAISIARDSVNIHNGGEPT